MRDLKLPIIRPHTKCGLVTKMRFLWHFRDLRFSCCHSFFLHFIFYKKFFLIFSSNFQVTIEMAPITAVEACLRRTPVVQTVRSALNICGKRFNLDEGSISYAKNGKYIYHFDSELIYVYSVDTGNYVGGHWRRFL